MTARDPGPARKIRETGGPTTLSVAGVADGLFLKRSGTTIVGAAASGGSGLTSALQTLSGTLTLVSSDANIQHVDPNGADRVVKLPTAPTTSMYFKVVHVGKANRITVQDNGGTYLSSVYVGESGEFAYDGTQWRSSRELKFGLPSIAMWLEADSGLFQDQAGTTPAVANSDPVGLWKDQSEWGIHVDDNANTSTRPLLLTANLNGHPVLDFGTHAGSNKSLRTTAVNTKNFGLNGDCAIIIVASRPWTTRGTSGVVLIGINNVAQAAGGPWLEHRADSNATGNWSAGDMIMVSSGFDKVNGAHAHASVTDADATWNLISAYTSKVSGIRKNGVDITNAENQGGVPYVAGLKTAGFIVGDSGGGETWDGLIAAIVMLTGVISLSDVRRIERYLGAKYGITIP